MSVNPDRHEVASLHADHTADGEVGEIGVGVSMGDVQSIVGIRQAINGNYHPGIAAFFASKLNLRNHQKISLISQRA
jgi:hypothetical protein